MVLTPSLSPKALIETEVKMKRKQHHRLTKKKKRKSNKPLGLSSEDNFARLAQPCYLCLHSKAPNGKHKEASSQAFRLRYQWQIGTQVSNNLFLKPRISCSSGGVNTQLWILIKARSLFPGQANRSCLFFHWLSEKTGGVTEMLEVAENGPGKMREQALPTSPHSFWVCQWRGSEFRGAPVDSFLRSPPGEGRLGDRVVG